MDSMDKLIDKYVALADAQKVTIEAKDEVIRLQTEHVDNLKTIIKIQEEKLAIYEELTQGLTTAKDGKIF